MGTDACSDKHRWLLKVNCPLSSSMSAISSVHSLVKVRLLLDGLLLCLFDRPAEALDLLLVGLLRAEEAGGWKLKNGPD